jgi:hypothetical protein
MGHDWVGAKVRFKERMAFRLLMKKHFDDVKAIVSPESLFIVRTMYKGRLDLEEASTSNSGRMVVNVPPELVERLNDATTIQG